MKSKPERAVDGDGTIRYYLNGKLHREDGPAIEQANWFKEWFLNGKLHRENGPAVEYANGFKEWFLNGKRHREDGPAVEYPNGTKWWFLNGKTHREDGPAVEWADGDEEWWLNGRRVSEKNVMERRRKKSRLLKRTKEYFGITADEVKLLRKTSFDVLGILNAYSAKPWKNPAVLDYGQALEEATKLGFYDRAHGFIIRDHTARQVLRMIESTSLDDNAVLEKKPGGPEQSVLLTLHFHLGKESVDCLKGRLLEVLAAFQPY